MEQCNEIRNWINAVLKEMSELNGTKGESILEKCGLNCANHSGVLDEVKEVRNKLPPGATIDEIFDIYKHEIYKDSPRLQKKGDTIILEYNKCECQMGIMFEDIDPFLCNCTRGYSKNIFELLFDTSVDATIEKSILKGDDICRVVIRIK